ncbi:MAG: response regulator [Phycisphaeraceae bacterium]
MSLSILIVDDAPIVLKGLKAFLEQLGCQVVTASGGAEALIAVGRTSFDIIFLDCLLCGEDGLAVARDIRNTTGHNTAVRIIGMRPTSRDISAEKCVRAGMNDSIEKLADADLYEAALRRWAPDSSG